MRKADKKAELLKKLQEELDKRTQAEEEAARLICECEFEQADVILKSLDDGIAKGIMKELELLDQEMEQDKDPVEEACEHVGQVIGDFLVDLMESILIETMTVNKAGLVQTCKAYSQSLSGLKRREEE